MHPYGYPQQPPPPRRGLSPLAIVLIVLSVGLVLGGGACVILGGLVLLGASADNASPDPSASPASGTAAPQNAGVDPTGGNGTDPPEGVATATANAGPSAPAPQANAGQGGQGGGWTTWWTCSASGSVRVCGFANVCNYISVFGTGGGTDRLVAQQQAKMNCEGQARARGGFTSCMVTCTPGKVR